MDLPYDLARKNIYINFYYYKNYTEFTNENNFYDRITIHTFSKRG